MILPSAAFRIWTQRLLSVNELGDNGAGLHAEIAQVRKMSEQNSSSSRSAALLARLSNSQKESKMDQRNTQEGREGMSNGAVPEEKFHVVVNEQGQYSLWGCTQPVPPGWVTVAEPSSRQECLDRIERLWTDL